MKGSPILRTLIAVIGLVLVGALLFRMTHAEAPASASEDVAGGHPEATAMRIRIRASHPPQSLTLRHQSEVIADFKNPQEQEWEIETLIEISPGGVELLLKASWPDIVDHAAVTVELEPDALEGKSQTGWSDAGEMEAYLTFQWP